MPLPPNAHQFTRPIDPADIEVFTVNLKKGLDADAILTPTEAVDTYTLTLLPEAVAAGLIIATDDGRETTLIGTQLRFWLKVDPAMQNDAIFDGGGQSLGLELTIETNSNPPRRKQRTLSVQVANQ
ncbi:hypothetical protein [Sphingomonas leidyi]|uniref:hypothetical protein n=1 Tax=Sphingomonas leidyi TaxID=68569 RepID=UPI0036D3292B